MATDLKQMPDSYWKGKLTPEQYRVMRQKGTETPWTGVYLDNYDTGMYKCVACGQPLFASDTKFESGTGWPSFYDVAEKGNVELHEDDSLGMRRIEVTCANCGAHLGHLFPDGPTEHGGQRYCINGCALAFEPKAGGGVTAKPGDGVAAKPVDDPATKPAETAGPAAPNDAVAKSPTPPR